MGWGLPKATTRWKSLIRPLQRRKRDSTSKQRRGYNPPRGRLPPTKSKEEPFYAHTTRMKMRKTGMRMETITTMLLRLVKKACAEPTRGIMKLSLSMTPLQLLRVDRNLNTALIATRKRRRTAICAFPLGAAAAAESAQIAKFSP